jgi:hypothetical protein
MCEEKDDPAVGDREETNTDVDAKLKAASRALIAEMEALIERAKILQLEHKAIIAERRKSKRLGNK